MSKPLVSICLPNLNTRPYLPERFESIFNQTFRDWELLVYDSYSNDGAWEYIQSVAATDPRIRAWQGPREGTPGSWNPCIREAKGNYVYIATSDDTMAPDCLEKMVAALEANPECDLGHCPLRMVDERSKETGFAWERDSLFARSSGPLAIRPHIRMAPYDGLLHLLGEGTTVISVTQLLIRRSLFERIGYFSQKWGSIGDFHWNMRAGLVASTVHVPDTWGGFRVHSSQATAGVRFGSAEHLQKCEQMIADAMSQTASLLPKRLQTDPKPDWWKRADEMRALFLGMAQCSHCLGRKAFLARSMLQGSGAAQRHILDRLLGRTRWPDGVPAEMQEWLQASGCGPVLIPVDSAGQRVVPDATLGAPCSA
jgi:hypothetical protein